MNIHIIIVTYALDITHLIEAIHGADIHWHIFTHHESRHDMVCRLMDQYPNIHDYLYLDNRGLAKSWNEGLIAAQALGADALLIANDDIRATRQDVEQLAAAVDDYYMVSAIGRNEPSGQYADMRFALAAIGSAALNTIGYFDENLFPIYFEDTDWQRRAELAGLKRHLLPDSGITHQGSATRNLSEDHYHAFLQSYPLNETYYVQKWGGAPGHECYPVPFNNHAFGLTIDRAHVHAPYEGYNRA